MGAVAPLVLVRASDASVAAGASVVSAGRVSATNFTPARSCSAADTISATSLSSSASSGVLQQVATRRIDVRKLVGLDRFLHLADRRRERLARSSFGP